VDFCKNLGIQTKFVSVIHPQANGQAEAANKVIINGIQKKLEAAKGLWAEQIDEVLWSYHTTLHSTTKEAPFTMVYGIDVMLPVEIDTPTWRRDNFSDEGTQSFPISLTLCFCRIKELLSSFKLLKIDNFSDEANEIDIRCTMDMIDEIREEAHIREFTAKQRAAR